MPGLNSSQDHIVELDDPSTWPVPVANYARSWAGRLAGTAEYAGDLDVPLEEADDFVHLLGAHRLAVFHCTRLLDAESEDVRRHGLRELTEKLVVGKVEAAYAAGALSEPERDHLLANHVFALNNHAGRTGEISVAIGRTALDEDSAGFRPLLTHWGGEGIYWNNMRNDVTESLRALGRPVIVSMAIDLSRGRRSRTLFFPSIHKVFVGRVLGLRDAAGEAHLPGSIAADEVRAIWHPGNPAYDQHPHLPRT